MLKAILTTHKLVKEKKKKEKAQMMVKADVHMLVK